MGLRKGLNLLVLAGSAEARRLARGATEAGARVEAWVSEPPRGPDAMPVPCKLMAFDDVETVAAAMAGFDAVLDASHGFDGTMSAMGCAASRQLGLPFLTFQRPPWEIDVPTWQRAADVAAAMPLIARGARVFSATGWASLPDCAAFPGSRLFLRQTSPHDRPVPYAFVEPVFGQPPFTVTGEADLFRRLAIDLLICRNLGGAASRPKLDAARALGIGAILIDRPALPPGVQVVTDMDVALEWVASL